MMTMCMEFFLGPKTINCCIGLTWPTLKLGPTLDIFILFLKKKEKEKRTIESGN